MHTQCAHNQSLEASHQRAIAEACELTERDTFYTYCTRINHKITANEYTSIYTYYGHKTFIQQTILTAFVYISRKTHTTHIYINSCADEAATISK